MNAVLDMMTARLTIPKGMDQETVQDPRARPETTSKRKKDKELQPLGSRVGAGIIGPGRLLSSTATAAMVHTTPLRPPFVLDLPLELLGAILVLLCAPDLLACSAVCPLPSSSLPN
jgi:hypothetical protein